MVVEEDMYSAVPDIGVFEGRKEEGMVDPRLRGEVGCLGLHCARGRCPMVVDIAVAARLMDLSSPWVLVVVVEVEDSLEVLESKEEDAHMNATGLSWVCGLGGRIAYARRDDGLMDVWHQADVKRESDVADRTR